MADRLNAGELRLFLQRFDPIAGELAVAARELVLDVFPDALETAEGKEIGYGFDHGYKGLVFALSLKKGGLNIGLRKVRAWRTRTICCEGRGSGIGISAECC